MGNVTETTSIFSAVYDSNAPEYWYNYTTFPKMVLNKLIKKSQKMTSCKVNNNFLNLLKETWLDYKVPSYKQ